MSATIGGISGSWDVGSLVISIEGVDTKEVFKLPTTPGVSPPSSLSLPASTTFHDLGFSPFTVQNAHIKFFVADDYYPDNTGSFLLTLVSPTLTYNTAAPSRKIIQMVGPCDWQTWVPGVICDPTGASPDPSQILGMDLGFSFEDKLSKRLVFLFGDTIGVQIPNGLSLTPALQIQASSLNLTPPMRSQIQRPNFLRFSRGSILCGMPGRPAAFPIPRFS